jgi:hypothetical protein
MNFGGFSWRRLVGISAFKSRISRTIGIPLTASGRRRKLGASVFNAVGSVVGTLAVAAAAAAEKESEKPDRKIPPPSKFPPKGVYFCEVKGVTHPNDDGTSRIAAQQLCSVGDAVKLIPEPSNEYDRNAIRVLSQTGEQIGYISATQAARFKGKVHLLTATVHSRVKDKWGNDTVKLRVSIKQQGYNASADPFAAIKMEALKAQKQGGWQSTPLVYLENVEQELYRILKLEDTDDICQSIQEGMVQVGFIGMQDTPEGILFSFALNDGLPTNGVVAKRFVVNASDWLATESKDLCARKGLPAPVIHDFKTSKQPTHIKTLLILLFILFTIVLMIVAVVYR